MSENPNRILVEDFTPYAVGGKANFTVKGNGLYHFKISKKAGPVWFVYAKEDGDWKYLGFIKKDFVFLQGEKSEFREDSKVAMCFNFIWSKGLESEPCNLVEIWYDGVCSRCGRKITDEISIKRGLGPTCYLADTF